MQDNNQRFIFTTYDWRGEMVCLSSSYQTIMQQHGYPNAIRLLLGEALLAAVLMTSTMKFDGQLTLQFESEGVIEMLVAKCTHDLKVRAVASWQPDASNAELAQGLADGHLVMTLHQAHEEPYQSIVPVKRGTIAAALQGYYLQSEQLPTVFRFAVDEEKATGMMLQLMPSQDHDNAMQDWTEAQQILSALPSELLLRQDNELMLLPFQDLDDIQLFTPREVAFHCPCSVKRMRHAVLMMGKEEIYDILKEKQEVVVTCEYCNHHYGFNRDEIDRIFQ